MAMKVPLTELKEGESGVITSIEAGFGHGKHHGCGAQKRLVDMGLTPGTKVTILRSAPLDGPIEISVRGYKLALGKGIAKRVLVEVQK